MKAFIAEIVLIALVVYMGNALGSTMVSQVQTENASNVGYVHGTHCMDSRVF